MNDGRLLVRIDLAGTALAVGAAALAAVSNDLAKTVMLPVSMLLGALGVVAFVWSYFAAVERSRTDEISVSQLYVVAGPVAPPPVKRALRLAMWTQIVVCSAVMILGFSRAEPEEFNWAATAIIVPLFAFGMNGMWVSRHGTFGPRILTPRPTRRRTGRQNPESDPEMEQNRTHG